MKMMITLLAGVFLFAGRAAHPGGGVVAPGRHLADLSRQEVYETLHGYGIPDESLARWESRLQPVVEIYRRDGPDSPELRRLYDDYVTVHQDSIARWQPRLEEAVEVYRRDGPHSPALHREYAKLGLDTLYDRGYLRSGYPEGYPFPSKKLRYVRVRDHVVITDLKQIVNIVPYDDSYAQVCLPEAEGVKVLHQIGGHLRNRFVTKVSSKTRATPEQAGLVWDRFDNPAYWGY